MKGNTETLSSERHSTTKPSWLASSIALLLALLITFAAAAIGARSMPGDWYESLRKPSFNPPNWIFGPVWTLLYAMMAIAAWLVWRDRGLRAAKFPLACYVMQLVLNALWSVLFFGHQLIGVALLDIIALWAAILITLVAFWRVNRIAGGLMIPYLAWVSFASVLNFAIWRLN